MDSLVLGEPQILGQVRDSFTQAVQAKAVKRNISKLFHQALRAGRKARNETAISRHAMSVSYVCVELVRRSLGELRDSRPLLVGVGEAGKLACRALVKAGVSQITVVNRTYRRACDLAGELGGIALSFDRLVEALSEADIVISATGASTYVISAAAVRQATREHNGNPLLLMDIAMPRDIDPSVADIPGVSLYDIDDLQAVSASNRKEREGEAVKVEAIIEEAVSAFLEAGGSSRVDSTLAALYHQAEELRQREVAKTLSLLPDISEKQRNDIETMSRCLIRRLLHKPMVALRGQGGAEDCETLSRLFNLDRGDDAI
jgi:glutamyl-tRNA reductase